MHIISNIALISINETLFIQLLSFLLFLFVIDRVMFRPLTGIADEREALIARKTQEIVDAGISLTTLRDEIKQGELAMKKEAFRINDNLQKAGVREAQTIMKAAKDEMTALRQKAEARIQAQLAKAGESVHKESEILALSIVEKILDRRI
jgi:F-type H+-transporting ATPase subunit b